MTTTGRDEGAWVPVSLTTDLPNGTVRRVFVTGHDLALWRSFSGRVSAWANRCPHRGMRLSHGFVRGEMLACLYHGWHYSTGGVCAYIPAHPDLTPPATITTTRFATHEAGGLIWVAAGDAGDPPDLKDAAPVRSITVDARVEELLDAPCDVAIQGMPDGRTVLHLTAPVDATPEGKRELSKWAEHIRRELEAGVAA